MARTINPEIAYNRLNQIVEEGIAKAQTALLSMQEEARGRRDYRVDPKALAFDVNGHIRLKFTVPPVEEEGRPEEDVELDITDHARGQLLGQLDYPVRLAEKLMGYGSSWSSDMLERDLRTLAENNVNSQRLLIRAVNGTGKGVLSDSYRVMDSGPIFTTFAEQAVQAGLVPFGGSMTESRNMLTFIEPKVLEPAPGEFVVYGARLTNSDYGRGALEMALFILRLICENGAVGNDFLRKVHLGARWGGNERYLSGRTHDLDTRTVASAVRDLIGGNRFHEEVDRVQKLITAGAAEVNAERVVDNLFRRARLSKAEKEEALKMYDNGGLPVEALPQSPGTWRLSNVFSLMANARKDSEDRKADLQNLAHEVLAVTRS